MDARVPLCSSLPTVSVKVLQKKIKTKKKPEPMRVKEKERERKVLRNELMLLWGPVKLKSVGPAKRLETQRHFYFIILRQNSFLFGKPQCFIIKASN